MPGSDVCVLPLGLLAAVTAATAAPPRFVDVTEAVGLGPLAVPEKVSRLAFADVDGDGWPDVVIDRHRVFRSIADEASPIGRRFVEIVDAEGRPASGLTASDRSATTVFVDLDNDGRLDAIAVEFVDALNPEWEDHGRRTGRHRGRGDGTFEPRQALPVPPRPSISVAAGDVNRDGVVDLFIGNTYERYGEGYEGFPNDLLVSDGPGRWRRQPLPDELATFDPEDDHAGRPTFGTMMLTAPPGDDLGTGTLLVALSYGRRWNRVWSDASDGTWRDLAPGLGLDGDDVRHGRHPEWLKERARTDARFDRDDEPPFRANGNTFDAAVGDVDNDGRLDLLLTEITHGWAGDSSDRSRVLVQETTTAPPGIRFRPRLGLSLDRRRADPQRWNQGDLFGALADLDHDGRLDVILASGDYPDNQRLRVFLQPIGGALTDATVRLGLDHDGAQQISLGDVDGDGDLDILVGQTFFRYPAELRAGRSPHPRLFMNDSTAGRGSITLHLRGDGVHVARDALGTVVRATLPGGVKLARQLVGIGGHAGKQNEFLVHLGLGEAEAVDELIVEWPDRKRTRQRFERVTRGRYVLSYGRALEPRAVEPAAPDRPFTEQGFLGLRARDIPGGEAVVSWIAAGPLVGEGLTSAAVDLARPDLIVAVDGRPRTADELLDHVHGLAPGSTIVLEYRRANRRGGTIPDAVDHEEEVRRLEVTLASRAEWEGTIRRGRGHDTFVNFERSAMLDPHDRDNVLGAAIDAHELTARLDTLLGVFREWRDDDDDYHALSRVRAGFDHPCRLPEIDRLVTDPAMDVPERPIAMAAALARANLDLDGPAGTAGAASTWSEHTPLEMRIAEALRGSTRAIEDALGELAGDAAFARACLDLLRIPAGSFYIGGADAGRHIEVIQRSMSVRFESLVSALVALGPLSQITAADLTGLEPRPVPDALRDVVEGEILAARFVEPIGWIVLGGDGPNRYDLTRIAAVVDRGGDDVYAAEGLRLGSRVIIDLVGNDTYTGSAEQGPASALLGAMLVDDRAGDDRYEGELLAIGAAMFGASLLLDRGGDDTYVGQAWSIAAACYGAGFLFDLGPGKDQYLGDFLCQGVGGPRGLGYLVDEGGRDLYRANGPSPSIYGTPAVYRAFSQGIGFGFRHYAAGGIGVLCDLGGADRYEAGEFAQGGAYYYGLGILHDRRGRDLYYGNRYGQGFGVHQALGILADDAGDDTYWSMTAASQGAAWDIGAGLLIDRAGDDSYQCDGLGQGGASMQAIGMLVDLAGRDRYVAGDGASQGQSGADNYHFHDTGALSFSFLIDLGGGDDFYSRGRANDAVTATGSDHATDPQRSTRHGLVIDR